MQNTKKISKLKDDGKWAWFMLAPNIIGFFLFMLVPTAICFFVYYISRRNVAKGLGYHPEEEE